VNESLLPSCIVRGGPQSYHLPNTRLKLPFTGFWRMSFKSSRTTIRSSRNRLPLSMRHGTISSNVRWVGTLIQFFNGFAADSKLRLPRSEAVLFPNKTSGIAGDPGYYLAELEIYHQLHCLVEWNASPGGRYLWMLQNQIRQALHPKYYPNWGMHTIGAREFHIDHCVDRIRQGLMCNADTSVLV
jgi:hypothetical protein